MSATYIAEPILKIDGAPASTKLIEDLLEVSVEESLHLPSMFTLVIRNDYLPGRSQESSWVYDNKLKIGTSIVLGFTASTTQSTDFDDVETGTLLTGEITGIEADFNTQSQAPIIVRGYDLSHRLHRGIYNRSFQNMTDTDIVKKIIGEVGITAGTIDDSGGPYGFGDPVGYVFQENQTNMGFLRERASRLGFELFIQDGKLHFRKPTAGTTLELKWLKDIFSFQVRISSAEQVSQVQVRGWDYQTKQAIVSSKSSQTSEVITAIDQGKGKTTSTAFSTEPAMIVVDQPVWSSKESDAIAQALYNELSGEFVQADAKADGTPNIRPGKVIKLTEMGKYSGNYYVTETRHLFQNRRYITEFSVRGLREGDLFSVIAPRPHLRPGQTMLVGVVSNNKDPKKWGRVRVKFPTLTEEHESDWARVVTIGAGANRGFDCLPEINDEVLVGFEHGDIHRPFVIGSVWNGKDAPPETVDDSVVGGKVRLRTFKTRVGHILQFVEEDKGTKQGIYLKTKNQHQVNLNDSEKKIEIKSQGGHQVLLDDQNKVIQIKTTGGHTCKLDDMGKKISLTSTGTIEISAPQEIKLTVGGNSIKISMTDITETMGANSIKLDPSGINIKSSALATLEGSVTSVKGNAVVTISAATVSIG